MEKHHTEQLQVVVDEIDVASEDSLSDDSDIDLYLFRDQNGDGDFSSDEEIAKSISSDSSEKIERSTYTDGMYGIAVLGYDVPGAP